MNFILACLIVIGIALLNVIGILLAAHYGNWWFLALVLIGCSVAFGKIGCAAHD